MTIIMGSYILRPINLHRFIKLINTNCTFNNNKFDIHQCQLRRVQFDFLQILGLTLDPI